MSDNRVLVTGAFGLVGSAVIAELARRGQQAVATDLDTPANRERAQTFTALPGVQVRWADLTSADDITALLAVSEPTAIIHLAALIPPHCYAHRGLAQAVNVDATATLVAAASAMSSPPRFVHASSIAVHGARNPHRTDALLTASTPVRPTELYGAQKALAERSVTSSDLDWVVLRLGGVLSSEWSWNIDRDLIAFEAVLPADGRIQTVDVRDVARAFATATATEHIREIFLIGGDRTHRTLQLDIGRHMAAAAGLVGGLPAARPGDPDDDLSWFATDWMDTARAQEVLDFQRHSVPDVCAGIRRKVGWRRWPIALVGPAVRWYLGWCSPYRGIGGKYADPMRALQRRWGDPRPPESLATELEALRR